MARATPTRCTIPSVKAPTATRARRHTGQPTSGFKDNLTAAGRVLGP